MELLAAAPAGAAGVAGGADGGAVAAGVGGDAQLGHPKADVSRAGARNALHALPAFAASADVPRSPLQNGEVSAEVAASVRASLQNLQEEEPGRGAQLRQLIQEARPQLPPPPRQPTPPPLMWDASGLSGVASVAAAAGAAPPLKRTAANMQQQQQSQALPSFHDTFFVANGPGGADAGRGAAPSLLSPASAEAARRAREARQSKRREKAATAVAAPVAAAAAPSAPAADGSSPSASDAVTSMGAVAAAALNARLDALEKEHRSAAMRLQFMNRQHSEMTLKIESLEARNAALVKENERLTGLWRACPLRLLMCFTALRTRGSRAVLTPLVASLLRRCRERAGVSGPGAGHLRRLLRGAALGACASVMCMRRGSYRAG